MTDNIINRVQKSGIITIDFEDVDVPDNIEEIDVKNWLHEGFYLKEKDFRDSIKVHDWEK